MPASPAPSDPIPDSPTAADPSIPLPLSASILLTGLPQDATTALEQATSAASADIPEKVCHLIISPIHSISMSNPLDKNKQPSSLSLPLSQGHKFLATVAQGEISDKHTMIVNIRLQPIGSAPQLRQKVFKISSKNRFETVVSFLRKQLFKKGGEGGTDAAGGGNGEGGGHVFCYVNSVFAPGLDEGVGGLWRVSFCFLIGGWG
ncbi:MAG: hypothetical protein LQ346_007642 [Caloplaca aetnensis]|nr:MAG: hypothetical protein LQ346_007642 [Caloplaca aetnensis]